MEGKNEVLEKQQKEFLERVEYLENQAFVVEEQHETEIKKWKELYEGKCNENQQVCYIYLSTEYISFLCQDIQALKQLLTGSENIHPVCFSHNTPSG